ncbi:MAG: ABC transporter ATP-binding protein [Bacteroidia bacterium]|jgi:phospholipid/cholesterol/gamma-HCH transport system ATP-binding protein|nr:ABC transporter ATP-binding protein [Bacteroidota bacterium]MBP6511939.1 ABC transporter ATP-binding protein [Bacteroidia bacterium]MBP7243678.1 ABC transporter ATP-binding protein [Bacteroidia bacterium]
METNVIHQLPKPVDPKAATVVEIKDLYKSFGSNHVLRGFNLNLKKGENLVVLGKSGSGKSVLIKCMVGLLTPDKGLVEVFGKNIPKLDRDELDHIRVKIGFLFQSSALYDSMTVRENLEFPLRRHWISKTREEVDELVLEALDNVGLKDAIDLMPSELSGGMRKRIGLARTLILKPDIILYDEPTTGLDPITSREISNLIVDIQHKYNTSSIIITHDMACAKIVSNRVMVLVNGIKFTEGTYDELNNSIDPQIKPFFE